MIELCFLSALRSAQLVTAMVCMTAAMLVYLQVNTPYPTAILIREKAMVINLESIRMIICKDQVQLGAQSTASTDEIMPMRRQCRLRWIDGSALVIGCSAYGGWPKVHTGAVSETAFDMS